jgi:very-short-patch-repair endonuclease
MAARQTQRKKDVRVMRAKRLRRDVTSAERKLWLKLRELPIGASHFRRQATIGPYFVDFACHAARLVIELDGGHHGDGAQAKRDKKRDEFLRVNGYRVLRFWNTEMLENVDGVLSVIYEALDIAIAPPTPAPSPPLASLVEGGEPRRAQRK